MSRFALLFCVLGLCFLAFDSAWVALFATFVVWMLTRKGGE